MTREGAPAVFVIHEVAVERAAVQGARDAAMDLIIGPFCNRLLIKGVRVRNGHAKRIANHALK
jgi:hypothetical protein